MGKKEELLTMLSQQLISMGWSFDTASYELGKRVIEDMRIKGIINALENNVLSKAYMLGYGPAEDRLKSYVFENRPQELQQLLLDNPDMDVMWSTNEYQSLLHFARERQYLNVARVLLQDSRFHKYDRDYSPLIMACERNNEDQIDIIKLWLDDPTVGPEVDSAIFHTHNPFGIEYLIIIRDKLGISNEDISKLVNINLLYSYPAPLREYLRDPVKTRNRLRAKYDM